MAGSNQSVNLQGMLGDLADSFNGMGDAYNFVPNAIRNISRPSVSMDDSTSLASYAAWARRNGFDDEAARYEALAYRQKEKEVQEAKDAALGKVMKQAINTGSEGMRLGEGGFADAADKKILELREQLANTSEPTAITQIQAQIDKLEGKRAEFKAAEDKENARRVVQLDNTLSSLDQNDDKYAERKAGIERVREDILSRGDAEVEYKAQRLELLQGENEFRAARWEQTKPAIFAQARAAGTDGAKWEALEERYGEFSAEIASIKGPMIELALLTEDLKSVDYNIENFDEDVAAVRDRIAESGMDDRQAADANALLDRVVETKKKSGGEYSRAAVDQFAAVMPSIDEGIRQANAAVAASERQNRDRFALAAQQVEALAMQEPNRNDVKFRAESLAMADEEDWDDLDPEDQASYLEKATKSIKEDMYDLVRRMNIRAGLEDPYDVTAEEASRISKLISSGADPREIATGLILEGYDPDQVKNAIAGKGVTSKQAEQILEEVVVEVERVDGSIYGAQTPMYDVMASRRMRGGKTADPNVPSNDIASRQKAALSDPANQWKGIKLTPFVNKLSEARSRQAQGQGFRYPGTAEMLGMGQQIEDYFGPTETRRDRR